MWPKRKNAFTHSRLCDLRTHRAHDAYVRVADRAGIIGCSRKVSGVSQIVAEVGTGRKPADFGLDVDLIGLQRIRRE
jgi:hypothetical protein